MTKKQTLSQGRQKIRIFYLEDEETDRHGIERMCELTPEGDLAYAGFAAANTPDLADRVQETQADMAIIDLILHTEQLRDNAEQALNNPPTSGVCAIEVLRRRFGPRLKIMALTHFPEWTRRALDAGADTVIKKGASFDELRTAIRNLVAGKTPSSFGIGEPVSLTLFIEPDQRSFVVGGERGKTPELELGPLPMTFLIYLAEERNAGAANYVKRTTAGMVPAHMNIWESIARRMGGSRGLDANHVLLDPARWAAQINQKLRPFLAQSPKPLILGPLKRGARATYSLSPGISKVDIVWPER